MLPRGRDIARRIGIAGISTYRSLEMVIRLGTLWLASKTHPVLPAVS